jgi:hypothetical protein
MGRWKGGSPPEGLASDASRGRAPSNNQILYEYHIQHIVHNLQMFIELIVLILYEMFLRSGELVT